MERNSDDRQHSEIRHGEGVQANGDKQRGIV